MVLILKVEYQVSRDVLIAGYEKLRLYLRMEDWYLALVQASSAKHTIEDVFSASDMHVLVNTIDTEPDPIPMRWLNAMLGRMFFGVYRTQALEQVGPS